MRKRITFIAILLAAVFVLGACSKVQNEYVKDLSKTLDWEAIQSEADVVMEMSFKNENANPLKVNANYKVKGYQTNDMENLQAEIAMDGGYSFESGEEKINSTIKDAKFYMNKDKLYMPLEMYKEIVEKGGKKLPEGKKYALFATEDFKDEKGESQLDYASYINAFMELDYVKDPKKAMDVYAKLADLLGIEVNTTKTNGKYVTVITGEDLVDMVNKIVENGPKKLPEISKLLQMEKIMDAVKYIMPNYNEEQMAKFKEALNKVPTKEEIKGLNAIYEGVRPQLMEALKNTKIETTEEFKDDSYISNMDITFKMPVFECNMKINSTQKKAALKEIKMPEDKEVIKYSELVELMPQMKPATVIDVKENKIYGKNPSDIKIIDKNGQKYFEARLLIENLGGKIGWNANTKQVTIDLNDKHIETKLLNENGVSFIGIEALKSLGLKITEIPESNQLMIQAE